MRSALIRWRTTAELRGAAPMSIEVELRYHIADPYVACIRLGSVDWRLDREMLRGVVRSAVGAAPVGEGDVRFSRCDRHSVRVELSPPTGHAVLELPAVDLALWLWSTYERVARGTESDHVDWETELESLRPGAET